MAEPRKHCGGTGLEPFVDGSMRYAEDPMTQPYTDTEIVARAIKARTTPGYWDAHHHADLLAEIATSALSAAGGRTRTSWAVRDPRGAVRRWPETEARRVAAECGGTLLSSDCTTWPDGTALVGPWLPVPEEDTDDG